MGKHINHTQFLSCDTDKDGNLTINAEQAKIVRRIYKEFLDSKGQPDCERLGEGKSPQLNWQAKWYESSN